MGRNPNKTNPWVVGRRTLVARTCPVCGEFQDGNQFRRLNGYLKGRCRKCDKAAVKASNTRAQRRSEKHAINVGKPWDMADLRSTKTMVLEGRSHEFIAKELGRTVAGIRNAIKYSMPNSWKKEIEDTEEQRKRERPHRLFEVGYSDWRKDHVQQLQRTAS